MKLLLDTHTFLWWLEDPSLLSEKARTAIANPRNFVFVSAISFVEIAIKEAAGKLNGPEVAKDTLAACRFHELGLTIGHASVLRSLPPIHKDPFDRLLIAQAHAENMTIVTRDSLFREYKVSLVAA